jgi:hypothetical protein
MSITGISSTPTSWQPAARSKPNPALQDAGASTGSTLAGKSADELRALIRPTDSITVNLPGGLSIGFGHFGSSPLSAEDEKWMADSVAQLAAKFANDQPAGDGSAGSALDSGNPDGPNYGATDVLHVGMPDGISFDIQHWSNGVQTEDAQNAITDQLTRTATELADALKAYLGGASGNAGTATAKTA